MIDNAVSIGKSAAPELLWTNPNPNSSFGGQTITFDSEYRGYIVELKVSTTIDSVAKMFVPLLSTVRYLFASTSNEPYNQGNRQIPRVASQSIVFGSAYKDGIGSEDNTLAIPTKIYGVNWTI